jgi:phosphomannomutase
MTAYLLIVATSIALTHGSAGEAKHPPAEQSKPAVTCMAPDKVILNTPDGWKVVARVSGESLVRFRAAAKDQTQPGGNEILAKADEIIFMASGPRAISFTADCLTGYSPLPAEMLKALLGAETI